jgi:hypothetical protein
MSCHGTFVIKDGQRLEGTLAFRLNVAGDPIVQWKQGSWQPPIPQAPPQTVPTSLLPASSSSAFHDGVTDREGWEAWFNGLSGDERTGALYWANQRSLSHPGRCTALEGTQKIGCQEAHGSAQLTRGGRQKWIITLGEIALWPLDNNNVLRVSGGVQPKAYRERPKGRNHSCSHSRRCNREPMLALLRVVQG